MRKVPCVETLSILSFLAVIIGFILLQLERPIPGLLAIILGFFWFFAFFTLKTYIRVFRERIGGHDKTQYFISLIAGVYGGLIVLAGDRLLLSINKDPIGSIIGGLVFLALVIIFTVLGLIALATIDSPDTSEEG